MTQTPTPHDPEETPVTTTETPSTGKNTAGNAGTMSERSRQEFATEVSRLKVAKAPGARDKVLTTLGLVLAGVGLVVTVLCYTQATGFSDLRDQVQTMILGLFGVGLTVLGSALYVAGAITRFLRLWMLRLVYEQRDH